MYHSLEITTQEIQLAHKFDISISITTNLVKA